MPTTPWAKFLVRERLAAKKTQDEVFDAVRAELNWGENSRSAYINLEHGPQLGGRDPSLDEQAFFSALYGGRTPDPDDRPVPALSFEERQLAVAERQAKAIADLVAELRAWRTEDRVRIAGQENLMQGVLATLAQLAPAGEARTAPLAPGR